MRKVSRNYYSLVILLCFSFLFNCGFFGGCDDGGGGGSVTNTGGTGGGTQPAVAEKQLIIEGPIPNEISENTSIAFPGGPSGADRAAEFGDSKQFEIAVIDRDDSTMTKELAPVSIETSENALYRYKYKTAINIENNKKTPFIAIKSKILNKVVLSSIPGQVPSFSEVPKDVKKIYIKGVLINSESTARSVLANDNKMDISVPVITLTTGEQSQEVVVRVLGSGDKMPADTIIENKVGGVTTIREMAKAVEAIKTVLVTSELTETEKRALFENTREKTLVPSAAGVISDYVLTLKNAKIQDKASELEIATSIDLAGTTIDGRSTVAVIDGGSGNLGGSSDNEPPSVTSVTITPKTVKIGDELQLAFTTSKLLIIPPKVVIYDRIVEVVKVDATTYSANTVVRSTDPKDVTFQIDNLVGENGKVAPPVTTTTDGQKPKVEEGVTAVYPPVFDPPTGVYKMSKIVTMYSKTPGSAIYYTIDGSEPSASSGKVFDSPFTVGADTTVKAVAVMNGISSIVNQASYVIVRPVVKADAPVFSFAGGSFSKAQSVGISTSTHGAVIKYTTDGSLPSKTNGAVYSSPIAIDKQMVLKAVALKDGMDDSGVTSAAYDVNVANETAPAPVFNPAPGSFISKQSVAIVSAVAGATVKYTLDGSTPSYNNGFIYKEPVVIMEPSTLKAVVIKEGMQDSDILSGAFDVNIVGPVLEPVAAPVFSPQEGKYTNYNEFKVKIITQIRGAKIIYTTDGTTPGASNGEIYSEPILITKSTAVKAVAVKDKMLDSEIVSALYEIRNDNASPAPPVIQGIADGAVTAKDVSLSWNEQEGVTSSARVIKDEKSSEYSKNSILNAEGSYTLEVSVVKTANKTSARASIFFVIDKSLPVVPGVIGIGTGEVTAKPVTFFWKDALWTKTTAKLVSKGGLKSDYSKGYEITGDGEYSLELTSTNERNGLSASSSISFTINSSLPEVPYITGVYNNARVSEDVVLDWEDITGETLLAKIAKNGGEPSLYARKTAISEEGSYKLVLEAKKDSTGTVNSRPMEFVIDKTEPQAPLITGMAEGALTSSEVRVSWEEAGDCTYSADISKDEGAPEKYLKNSVVASAGKFLITVTAVKNNGLKKSSARRFVIDKNPPDAPLINVTDEGQGVSIVKWEETPGVSYSAKISKNGGEAVDYIKGSQIKEPGLYVVTVKALRLENGVENKSSATFNREPAGVIVAPEAPPVRGIEDGSVSGADVSITWQDITSVLTFGRLKKNGGEFAEYVKGSMITEDGSYVFEVEAKEPKSGLSSVRKISFTIDKKAPAAPVVTGLKDGETAGSEVKLSWNEQDGCETTARLTKSGSITTQTTVTEGGGQNQDVLTAIENLSRFNDERFWYDQMRQFGGGVTMASYHRNVVPLLMQNKQLAGQLENYYYEQSKKAGQSTTTTSTQSYLESPYDKNYGIASNGEYILEVTALKKYNGLKAVSRIKFTLDQSDPVTPVLSGVENGSVTSGNVTVTWEKGNGINYLAKLVKDDSLTLLYESGSPITIEGAYYLEVIATNKSNGKTASASRKFKIDRSVPALPAIKGISDGAFTDRDVEITWDELEGASTAAKLTKTGSNAAEYKKGSKITEDGGYTLELTVKNSITGISNKKTIYFTIDRKKPDVPVITGIADGSTYADAVSASWQTVSGVTFSAVIMKDESNSSEYSRGTPVTVDGNYQIIVTAKKLNGLISEKSVKFTIDKVAPAPPAVDVSNKTAEGGSLYGPTLVGWTEQEGCVTTAELSKNGQAPTAYQKETPVTEEGKYLVEVTALKLKNGMKSRSVMRFGRLPEGFDAGPAAPKLRGVEAGSVNSKEISVSWEEEKGVSYYAKLVKNGGNPLEFVNGSKISSDGSYSLEVTAKKSLNGQTNRSSVSFKIDTALPAVPLIEGVSSESVSATDVRISWKESSGVFYYATIKRNDEQSTSYGNGFPITLSGKYALDVTATKLSNNLTSKATLNFTVDKNPPEEPVVTGVETGAVTPNPVTLEWKQQEGVKISAVIIKNGGNPQPFTSGTAVSPDGSYRIEVTAVKVSNGLSYKHSKSFIINKSMPEMPRVSGVENLKVYNSPVTPSWDEPNGFVLKARLVRDGGAAIDFVKGTPIAVSGKYKLVVTASGNNGLSNEFSASFIVDLSVPAAPAISVLSKGDAMVASWVEDKEYTYSAKISKVGGIAEEYKKETPITEDGSYTLELTVTKISNGLTGKSSVNFTKAGVKVEKGPVAPEVSGAVNGRYYNAAVIPSWKTVDGATVTATLTKIGGQPAAFENSSKITEDGNYILEVTAANKTNNIASKTLVAFAIDTARPSSVLSYGSNPATEGVVRITASFSEILAKESAPKISIDQPGSADITAAAMSRDASAPAVWYYDYTVKAADGSSYIDGVASVKISDVYDQAGNVSQAAANNTFVINTSAPSTAVNYSFTPAVPQVVLPAAPQRLRGGDETSNIFKTGKLTVIATFSKDVKAGQTPKIYIDQPGSLDVKEQAMVMGNSRRVWSYEYAISADDGRAYIDGQARVSISQVMDESGKIFSQPANAQFTIDTKDPAVELSYSSNPAPAGKLTITAKYSEPLKTGYIPYISIFQQGVYEITDAAMKPGSTADVWTYEYTVTASESGDFKDGKAMIFLSSVTDAAGNISKRPSNQTFLIGTAVKTYAAFTFSSNPARAGKLRITATFKDDYAGAKGPRINIEQPGKADVQQKWMDPGASKKAWTFDYVINDNNGADFMDGIATVTLLDEKQNPIEITGGNTFVIDTTPPVVSLLSLNDAGQKLIGGSSYNLKWTASDSGGLDPKPVTIAFYNGLNWTTVETNLANTGSYDWKVPSVDISTAKVSVSAVDMVGNRATASSLNSFTIISSGPAWSMGYPKSDSATASSIAFKAKSDRSGRLYYVCVPSSANLSSVPPAAVKSGVISGVQSVAAGTGDISANTEYSFEIKGLTADTSYDTFLVIEDSDGIIQSASQKVTASTPALFKGLAFMDGYPKASTSGERYNKKINLYFKTNAACKVYVAGFVSYTFQNAPALPPTSADVKNGKWDTLRNRPQVSTVNMESGVENNASIDLMMIDPMMMMEMDMPGMTPRTNYIIYAVAEDSNGKLMDNPVKIDWKAPSVTVSIPTDAASLTKSSMKVKVKPDSNCEVYYVLLKQKDQAPTAPSAEQIKNGTDASGNAVDSGLKGTYTASANTEKELTISNLSESTQYYFYAAALGSNKVFGSASGKEVTRGAEPVVTSGYPMQVSTGWYNTTVAFRANAAAKLYTVVLAKGSKAPTAEQIKKGTDAGDKAPVAKGSAASIGEYSNDYWASGQTISYDKLSHAVTYDLYYVFEDAAGKLWTVRIANISTL